MVARILIIASVACVFNLANGLSDPFPGFKPCKVDDDECVLENSKKGVPFFADGIPELDVKTLDPDFFKKVDASSQNLKFILSNITLTGLKSCVPTKVTRDVAKSEIVLVIQCSLNLDGDYEMDGRVLIIDIRGKGKIHVFLKNIVNTVKLSYNFKKGKDGKEYLRVKKFDHTYELKDKSDVEFGGLFQENAVLRQATEEIIKNNGNEIVDEIGVKMFLAAVTRIVENINRFFAKIPYNELIIA